MKILLFTISFLLSTLSLLFAQAIHSSTDKTTLSTTMHTTPTSEEKEMILEHIHAAFPESTSVPSAQLQGLIVKAWQKGLQYEFNELEDLGIYVMATYALGDNFEENVRGALRLLEDSSLTSRQKADRLETLARQELSKREEYTEGHRDVRDIESQEAAMQAAKVSTDEYTETQNSSQPYRQLAIWAVDKLRNGDMTAVLQKFSPTVIEKVGMPKVEIIFQERILPMFTSSTGVSVSTDVGKTRDAFGHEGFVFFMDLSTPQGIQPVMVMVLKENEKLVIGSLAHDERK
ncbi:hypothetical protein GXP67_32495 [Rhodocytophaga rosea]|uniref:DUF3887 domain-containing protein n=1 Tax=Rhodocytophaga rosea TaxID=2704465 RepID=A0A6C0GSF8_9BACT|nr:hypothetical protein [Rhodocytophaga rosea]QHT71038.1 hypothetical protein GXP67_32495 [Rhodocytophaga rosea]